MKRMSVRRITALIAAVLMFCLLFTACKTHNKNLLNAEQETAFKNIAEAFFEYGDNFDSGHPLSSDNVEMFIYYFYNDKLKADDTGFAVIGKKEANEFLKSAFDFSVIPHANREETKERFFYENGEYHIKICAPSVTESVVKNVTSDSDGNYEGYITCRGEKGITAELVLKFKFTDSGIQVLECKRFDYS